MLRSFFLLNCLLAVAGCHAAPAAENIVEENAASQQSSEAVDFAHDVRPLLANSCYDCHGPDANRRRANLRLDTKQGWQTPLESGHQLVVPGKRDESELWRRISTHDRELRMPAAESKQQLTPEQIETLGRWIDAGAKWSPHWAYVASIAKPGFPVPRERAYDIRPATELKNRSALLRRITFDLSGLPPTPAELQAFEQDRSPDAYLRVVDRLLASPRFGERMAQDWLDLARYADTHGYHSDSQREMWRWRDWVIEALNSNMPFDRFTIEQLAGDQLPNATLSQKIASGFNRNNMVNHENGAIPEEYRTEYVIDRTITTGTVWLGQTWVCARCHDHKYDPLSQRDFYRLFAYFNNVPENGLDGRDGNVEPFLAAPTEEQQSRMAALEKERERIATALAARVANCTADFLAWQTTQATLQETHPGPDDMLLHVPLEDEKSPQIQGNANLVPGKFGQALLFDGETHVRLGETPPLDNDSPLGISLWMFPTSEEAATLVARVEDVFTSRGLALSWQDRHLVVQLTHERGKNERVVQTEQQFPLREWQHVAMVYDPQAKSPLTLFVQGEAVATKTTSNTLSGSVRTRRPWLIGLRDSMEPWRGMLDEIRLYDRSLASDEVARLAGQNPLGDILAKPAAKRSAAERAQLMRCFLDADATHRGLRAEMIASEREAARLERSVTTTMIMSDRPEPRETFVLQRGLYNQPREQVTAGVPEQLLAPAADLPASRLGLAKWLVDRRHPLTARVAVNRYWSHFMGRGIVATPEDFGVRGAPPSDPELLDFLAIQFMESGWDVKQLVRLMVSSRAYVQPEIATSDLAPIRLPAEAIRDSALFSSGLLGERIGGPGVNPYQPVDLWKGLAYDASALSAQSFRQGTGADLYRRSLYTFWKRAAPPPLMTLFDAPNRETCTVERSRTSSPLQALALMNDVTFVEAARALAERTLNTGESNHARIDFLFRSTLSRSPSTVERARLVQLYEEQLRHYRTQPEAAQALIAAGDSKPNPRFNAPQLAAWTVIANVLFNLEEFATK